MNEALTNALVTFVSLLLGLALNAARQWMQKRYSADQIQTAVDISRVAAQATEQIWAKLPKNGGVQKLDEALKTARKLAEGHGIKLSDKQWQALLESAVHELNRAKTDLGITNAVGYATPPPSADEVADRAIKRVQDRLDRIGFLP
jgi:hypothetical protein